MRKHFYSHIIEFESIYAELDDMDLSLDDRKHLGELLDSTLHHTVLDAVLSELSEEDKKVFMGHLQSDEHEKIWEHLNKNVDNIEKKIKTTADELKERLHKDIREAKKV